MGFQGEKLCTLMEMITGLAINDDDPIERPAGVILPEDDFDWFIDVSCKLDDVMKIPRYRFQPESLVHECLRSLQNSFADMKESEEETGVVLSAEETEQKIVSDLIEFLDACLEEAQRYRA
jgi:hypothetical protein